MDYNLIRVKMEALLSEELYDLIDGAIIEQIINEGKIESQKDVVRMIHEGQAFKVTEKMAPNLWNICTSVKKSLQFEEGVSFYINNSPEINAYAIYHKSEDGDHTVALNSGLIERFTDEELKFIIGHELGHLISRYARLNEIIKFVFPEGKQGSSAFFNKLSLWMNLSELSADRYGFIASPDLGTVVSCFFKMASGLDSDRIAFSPEAYLEETEKVLEYFNSQPYSVLGSHPINPVRIKAIELFSKSALFTQIAASKEVTDDQALHEKTDELVGILLSLFESELDVHMANFAATGGLLIAGADENFSHDEINEIVESLSAYTIFPRQFLDNIHGEGKIIELFNDSVQHILAEAPSLYINMIRYLTNIAISDKKIAKDELDLIFDICESAFGVSRREIAQIVGEEIISGFLPRLFKE